LRKFFILLNPASGQKNKRKLQVQVEQFLTKREIEFECFYTERKKHATELISELLTPDFTDLMVVGGDGTLNEVINGLSTTQIPISIIPKGTGNDFAKALKLPKKLNQQLDIAINGNLKSVDVGKCNDQLFLNTMGFGFDGKVVEYMEKNGKPAGGHLAYMLTVLRIVTGFSEPTVKFKIDGKSFEQPVFLMAINNGTVYGGGFNITPDAKLDDGIFDICLIGKISPIRRLMNFPKMQLGVHQNVREINMLQGREFEISANSKVLAQVDGELIGNPPFRVSILGKHLKFRC
jgi:YegS/Rv2252/BmrU family lipid kinase